MNYTIAGQLTAEVRSIDGAVPVEIVQKDRDRFSVSFIPRVEGTDIKSETIV